MWDYSYQHVPYYGTNTPIDECYECGFTGEFECTSKGFTCPKCGNHDAARVSVTRRVCGYLGSPDARPFNAGKQEEVKRRVKHWAMGRLVNSRPRRFFGHGFPRRAAPYPATTTTVVARPSAATPRNGRTPSFSQSN